MTRASADDLKAASCLEMNPETFLARRDHLRKQARELLTRERRERVRRRVARFLLPWAGLLTLLPYSNRLSRFLDRLTAEAERE
ncbi:MAG: hypothetical protein C4576_09135 [Desulfobacteraceae bacterium]|nr:MAG: hypothetical protein C4576_09135 [Desulfobacteraceae bacterium]